MADGAVLPGDPLERRRALKRTLRRILLMTSALMVLYVVIPVPGASGAAALVEMLLGLAVFLAVVAWQVRAIMGSEQPIIRALEVLGFALPLLIFVFAFVYLSVSRDDVAAFSEELSRLDSVYFTVTTLATVGYGDITPVSDAARTLVIVQMLFDLGLIAGLVRVIILATRLGVERRHGPGTLPRIGES